MFGLACPRRRMPSQVFSCFLVLCQQHPIYHHPLVAFTALSPHTYARPCTSSHTHTAMPKFQSSGKGRKKAKVDSSVPQPAIVPAAKKVIQRAGSGHIRCCCGRRKVPRPPFIPFTSHSTCFFSILFALSLSPPPLFPRFSTYLLVPPPPPPPSPPL